MSDIEEGVVEELPTSEEDLNDSSYDEGYEESDDVTDSGSEGTSESERERLLQQRVLEQERIIQLLQDNPQGRQPQEEPEQDYDYDDIPTYEKVESIVDKKTQDFNNAIRQMRIDTKVREARSKYDDYDNVVTLGQQVVGNNKRLAEAILEMDDPAEFVYNLGKSHPQYKPSGKNGSVVDKVKRNLNKPNTLNQATGGNPSTKKSFKDMSKEELEREIRKVRFGR